MLDGLATVSDELGAQDCPSALSSENLHEHIEMDFVNTTAKALSPSSLWDRLTAWTARRLVQVARFLPTVSAAMLVAADMCAILLNNIAIMLFGCIKNQSFRRHKDVIKPEKKKEKIDSQGSSREADHELAQYRGTFRTDGQFGAEASEHSANVLDFDVYQAAGAIVAPALQSLAREEGVLQCAMLPHQILSRFDNDLLAGPFRQLWQQAALVIGFHPDEVRPTSLRNMVQPLGSHALLPKAPFAIARAVGIGAISRGVNPPHRQQNLRGSRHPCDTIGN